MPGTRSWCASQSMARSAGQVVAPVDDGVPVGLGEQALPDSPLHHDPGAPLVPFSPGRVRARRHGHCSQPVQQLCASDARGGVRIDQGALVVIATGGGLSMVASGISPCQKLDGVLGSTYTSRRSTCPLVSFASSASPSAALESTRIFSMTSPYEE